ncbi:MAG TPA: tRNA (guanosine(46)-N7)-methyltransferase TrmB [Roseivirga sp.]
MGRAKLRRFEELKDRHNVLEDYMPLYSTIKGNWNKSLFPKEQPIILELACGKGHYATGLAKVYPERNYIGIDVKGDRLWVGSTIAIENELTNVAFLRAQIQHLDQFFESNEVAEIWITFPDPRPKDRDIKRRLTSPRFLDLYKQILVPEGIINFKTDNTMLFEYTLAVLAERNDVQIIDHTFDLYHSELTKYHHEITTEFEKKFLNKGEKIKYLRFKYKHES